MQLFYIKQKLVYSSARKKKKNMIKFYFCASLLFGWNSCWDKIEYKIKASFCCSQMFWQDEGLSVDFFGLLRNLQHVIDFMTWKKLLK